MTNTNKKNQDWDEDNSKTTGSKWKILNKDNKYSLDQVHDYTIYKDWEHYKTKTRPKPKLKIHTKPKTYPKNKNKNGEKIKECLFEAKLCLFYFLIILHFKEIVYFHRWFLKLDFL